MLRIGLTVTLQHYTRTPELFLGVQVSVRSIASPAAGVAIALFAASGALADDASVSELVVTATNTPVEIEGVPASVTVITQEDIRRRFAFDLADMLEGTPGVTVGGAGTTRRSVTIRGMTSGQTLFLVDGQRVTSSLSAMAHSDFDLAWVPTEAIDRVEVVRGPMSSLYGSDALGGVINVITRSPTESWIRSVSAMGGHFKDGEGDTYEAAAYFAGSLVQNRLGMTLALSATGRKDTPLAENLRLSELEGRRNYGGEATLTWTPDSAQRIDLALAYGEDARWRDTSTTATPPKYYKYYDDVGRFRVSLRHRGDWSWGVTTLRAYRAQLDRENRRTAGEAPTAPQTMTEDLLEGLATIDRLPGHRITTGFSVRGEQLEDATVNKKGKARSDQYALFAQDEMAIGDSLSLVAGVRFDHHEAYDWHTSPRAYMVYRATPRLTIKGGVGAGFKSPTLKQLSPEYVAIGGGNRFYIYGAPGLQPETSKSSEVSAEYRADTWRVQAVAFRNDLENLIETFCVSSCGVRLKEVRNYRNVSQARTEGVELSGEVDLPADLSLRASYSTLRAKNRQTGAKLNERPSSAATVTLDWRPSETRAAFLRVRRTGSQLVASGATQVKLPDYSIWSVGLTQALGASTDLRLEVDNIGDERLAKDSSLFTFAEPGRVVNLGLTVRF